MVVSGFEPVACYHPLIGVVEGRPYTVVPCGVCIGCKLERSRQWAVRCMHEAQMVGASSFITLTYNDEKLPVGGSLLHRDFQLFVKRLRKKRGCCRFLMCGEYGERFSRPHYHACLFGVDFPDKVLWKSSPRRLYQSRELLDLWGLGHVSVGAVTFESAAYVARYALQKVNGGDAVGHYERVDSLTGEIFTVVPEYTTMSKKPGLGASWYARFRGDIFPSDECVVRGKVCKPPRYYDKLFDREAPDSAELVRRGRVARALERRSDNTRRRLEDREVCKKAQVSLFQKRVFDGGG